MAAWCGASEGRGWGRSGAGERTLGRLVRQAEPLRPLPFDGLYRILVLGRVRRFLWGVVRDAEALRPLLLWLTKTSPETKKEKQARGNSLEQALVMLGWWLGRIFQIRPESSIEKWEERPAKVEREEKTHISGL